MTKFIDLNIYTNSTVPPSLPNITSLSEGTKIMNPAEIPGLRFIFEKIVEQPDHDEEDEEQLAAKLNAEKEK